MNDGSALFQSEKCKLTCLCRRWRLPSSPAIWTHRLTTTPAAPCAAYPSPCPYPSRPWSSRAPQSCPRPCSSALRQPSPDIGTVGPAAPSSSPTGRRGWRRRGRVWVAVVVSAWSQDPGPLAAGWGPWSCPPPLAGNASPPREAVPQETVVKEVDIVGLDLAFDFDLNLSMWVGRSALCGSPPSACQHLPWDVGEAGHRGMGTRRGCGKTPRRMRRDGAASEWEDMVGDGRAFIGDGRGGRAWGGGRGGIGVTLAIANLGRRWLQTALSHSVFSNLRLCASQAMPVS